MPFGSSQWMYSSGGFYPHDLEQSLRFNDDDSAYLSFTPSTDGTSLDTQTFSFWVKRANIGSTQFIIGGQVGGSFSSEIGFNSNDTFSFYTGEGRHITTNQVFRDPSAWYHIVAVYDSTQATESNRLKLYVNGEEITSFSNATYPKWAFPFPLSWSLSALLEAYHSHMVSSFLPNGISNGAAINQQGRLVSELRSGVLRCYVDIPFFDWFFFGRVGLGVFKYHEIKIICFCVASVFSGDYSCSGCQVPKPCHCRCSK